MSYVRQVGHGGALGMPTLSRGPTPADGNATTGTDYVFTLSGMAPVTFGALTAGKVIDLNRVDPKIPARLDAFIEAEVDLREAEPVLARELARLVALDQSQLSAQEAGAAGGIEHPAAGDGLGLAILLDRHPVIEVAQLGYRYPGAAAPALRAAWLRREER